ncbi:extracellular ribonuclease-like [Hibiscus syriacus]|uniref:RING-type E3 ubiquitin transferase n=1 Tax=Hibiscus syriacus TaxID=106335 RepID=A0A6A2Y9B3_HIBSY|nr:RING-H2 finger protein ATL43 [Hibiscus syriacus]KAE8678805.1 extracellular ribonuclease-like [Hibiscus syriacus]
MSSFYPLKPFLFTLFLQIFIPPAFADNYHNSNNTNITNNPSPSPSLRPGSSSFKPSTAVFIFLAVLSVLFCVIFLLLLYSKRCGTDSDNNPFGYAHASSLVSVVSAGRNSGLNQVVVESLPMFRFSSLRGQKDGLECAVCLTRFEPNELLRLLPKCKHAFHAECVDTWLDAHSTCPLCRYRVDPEDILLIQDQDLTTVSPPSSSSNRLEDIESEPSRTRRVSGRHSYAAGERTGSRTTSCCRKDGLLLVREDERKKRVEHRIIVSGSGGGAGNGFHQRWSDVQPSDLLYLRSEMIISQSGRLGIGSVGAEGENNNKNMGRDENGNGTGKNGSEA